MNGYYQTKECLIKTGQRMVGLPQSIAELFDVTRCCKIFGFWVYHDVQNRVKVVVEYNVGRNEDGTDVIYLGSDQLSYLCCRLLKSKLCNLNKTSMIVQPVPAVLGPPVPPPTVTCAVWPELCLKQLKNLGQQIKEGFKWPHKP